MPERIELGFRIRDEGSGQIKKLSQELKNLNASINAGTRSTAASAATLKQAKEMAAKFGLVLVKDTAPAVKATAAQLDALTRSAAAMDHSVRQASGAFGLSRAGADAFTRAATRTTAALGFISPTAATAAAQLDGLFQLSATGTLILAGASVGAIALATGLYKSTQAAIAFESSFVGIRKTVEATDEEFAELGRQNRALAISLGTNVNTINNVGRAAGSLGIAVKDIVQFERIIIELASASEDLSADEAAASFGRLAYTLSLSVDDIDRLTNEVVDLGNKFTATEGQITELLNRISGAGAVLKISGADLVGIAAAMSSVSKDAEASGSAIQRVLLAMQGAAVKGGDELKVFSGLLGLTGEQFRELVRTDPTEVFTRFVEQLAASGEEAQLWLEALELSDVRLTREFLRLAAAGGLLRDVIDEGRTAVQESSARHEEFQKQLNTTAGQLNVAKAAIGDLAIEVGTVLLPYITLTAQIVADFAAALRELGDAAGYATDKLNLLSVSLPGPLPDISVGKMVGETARQILDPTPGPLKAIRQLYGHIDTLQGLFRDQEEATRDADIATTNFVGAMSAASGGASTLGSNLGGLAPDISAIGTAAEDARKKLFAMFSEPTVEEEKARLTLLGLQQELNNLRTLPRPWTQAEKDRVDVLQNNLIPAQQAYIEKERLIGEVAKTTANLQLGGLKTQQELTDAIEAGTRAYGDLASDATAAGAAERAAADAAWMELKTLVSRASPLVQAGFGMIVRVLGEDEARVALRDLLAWGGKLTAEDFVMNVRVDGVEYAIRQVFVLASAGDTVAASMARAAISFGLLTEQNPYMILEAVEAIKGLSAPKPGEPPFGGNYGAQAAQAARAVRTLAEELADLEVMLGARGLSGDAAVFRAALISLKAAFKTSEETVIAYLHRLAAATLDFARQRLGQVLGAPTRETLAMEFRLAQLQRQRSLMLRGGATEEELADVLEPLDRQIEAIERELDLRKTEIEIMRIRGQLADEAILTDREMIQQATMLIGLISDESGLIRDLNLQLDYERLALIGATTQLGLFSDALLTARGLLPAPGSAYTSPYAPNISIRVNVNAAPGTSDRDVRREVDAMLARALRDAAHGGGFVSSGTFVPG